MTMLPAIELYGSRLESDAKDLTFCVAMLTTSPNFRTLAEANLERARAVLAEGLASVDAALAKIEQARQPVRHLQAAE
jgi:hypothetical protein